LLFVYYLGYSRGYTLTIGIGISTLQRARRLVNPRQQESQAKIKKRRENKEVASLIYFFNLKVLRIFLIANTSQ